MRGESHTFPGKSDRSGEPQTFGESSKLEYDLSSIAMGLPAHLGRLGFSSVYHQGLLDRPFGPRE